VRPAKPTANRCLHPTSTRAHPGQPKALILATPYKPDLRFNLLDNEAGIATGAEQIARRGTSIG
jgi:hypothetical protein